MKKTTYVNPLCLHSRTNLHMKTPPHTIIQKFPPKAHHTPLQYYISVKIIHTSFTLSIKTFVTSFIKPQKGFITTSVIMSNCWQPSSRSPIHSWGTAPSNTWYNWKPSRTRAPGRQLSILKHPEVTLVDGCPTKDIKLAKGGMIDTLPMEILSTIHDWITILKYNDKHMAIAKRIKVPKIPRVHAI